MRKVNSIIITIVLVLCLVSSSRGFDSDANKVNQSDPNNSRQRPYTRENATKPLGQGGYYGGHDTITAEGMLLKEQVHQRMDIDGGADFRKKMVEEALPYLRVGAHDEDSTRTGPWYIGSEPPIGRNGSGNFYHHFYDPDTGEGLLSDNSALKRAKDYDSSIRSLIGCRSLDKLSGAERERIYDYFGRILHLIQDMGIPSHIKRDPHLRELFEKYTNCLLYTSPSPRDS